MGLGHFTRRRVYEDWIAHVRFAANVFYREVLTGEPRGDAATTDEHLDRVRRTAPWSELLGAGTVLASMVPKFFNRVPGQRGPWRHEGRRRLIPVRIRILCCGRHLDAALRLYDAGYPAATGEAVNWAVVPGAAVEESDIELLDEPHLAELYRDEGGTTAAVDALVRDIFDRSPATVHEARPLPPPCDRDGSGRAAPVIEPSLEFAYAERWLQLTYLGILGHLEATR